MRRPESLFAGAAGIRARRTYETPDRLVTIEIPGLRREDVEVDLP
jgi:hypothetical protein